MSVSTLAGTQRRWRAQALASGPLYTSRLAATGLLDGAQDQPCHGLRLRHHGHVRSRHLFDPRVPALGHETIAPRAGWLGPRCPAGTTMDGPPPGRAAGLAAAAALQGRWGRRCPLGVDIVGQTHWLAPHVSIQGLPHVVVLLMGLDSSVAGINALSWCANTAGGPRRIPSDSAANARQRCA
jgi:hypothetical protein